MPPKKKTYIKKDPISHVLDRPDMYVGSKRQKKIEDFIAIKEDNEFKIVKKNITYSPAILRIFVEVLSNAIDNVERSKKAKKSCTMIKVSINKETGETSIWNDGDIIPIEINEEEGIYNHSLIFGNLMAGSNFDDEEERLISGRNGLGSKCVVRGTKVPCFDGSIKNVEDIKIGDILIGDDGKKREVLNTIHGFGEMYEVSQSRGDSYIVNSEHILSLRMPDHKVIYWSTEKQGWQMVYLDAKNKKIHSKSIRALKSPGIECPECGIILNSCLNRHYRRIHKNKEIPNKKRKSPTINPPNDCEEVRNAYIEMQKFAKTITDDNTIDISIQDYLKLHNTFKSRLTGFKSECVQWERKKVDLDPYVLGLWLGDGYQNGRGFAINAEDDYQILEYLKDWGKKNDANFTNLPICKNCKENKYDPHFVPCKNCASFSISSIENYGKMYKVPLRNLLKKYDLLEEKFIPIEYKVNDRDTRLKVLAGLIDSDGYVSKEREGRRINISQGLMHEKLSDDILYLARSLGFNASKIIRDVTWTYQNEKRFGKCISINISGNGLEDIPTLLPRKKCTSPLKHEVLNTGPIKIKKVENGKFVGLTIDGNERFVINDFTVTHNCTNIFSKKFIVKGLDPDNKKVLEQTWTNNMRNTTDPKITDTKLKNGFTKITYFPDFKQFDLEGYTDDIINLYTKYVIDAAMLTNVKVYLNEELIPVNNLVSYSKLYASSSDDSLLIKNKNSEVLIMPSNINEFQAISFVNGVYTRIGGAHVDAFAEAIFRPIVEKFNKKGKPQLNIKDVKQFFKLFVVSTVINPEFSSQDKEKLESPKIDAEIKQSEINKILKWNVISEIEDIIKMKEMSVLKKSEKKKKGYTKIEGMDHANNAGGKLGYQCSLILCEGLSAKTYAVAGIKKGVYGKSGRDYYGILPLRGKCIAPDTKVILWNGDIKKAEDIKIGDYLINEEGEKTEVLELFTGEDKMYEIQQNKFMNYTVNSQHTLSLKLSGNNNITWSDTKNSWNMIYYDINDKKAKTKIIFCKVDKKEIEFEKCIEKDCIFYGKIFSSRGSLTKHYKRFHTNLKPPKPKKSIIYNNSNLTKEEGYNQMIEFRKNIKSPNIIDIDINDYQKLDDYTKYLLKGFKLETCINWEHKNVEIDPYILGLWLGDGYANGYGFASEDVEIINEWYKWANMNNCEIVHNNPDSFIIRKKYSLKYGGKDKRVPIGTIDTSNENCRACDLKLNFACSNDEELKKHNKDRIIKINYEYNVNKKDYGLNPFKELLSKYNLVNNKDIPNDYIYNDKETRLKILAGFIDTDGYIGKDGRIEIVQSYEHKNLIDKLFLICKSLGFYCKLTNKKASYTYKSHKKYSKAIRLMISGNNIKEIPTVLLRKQFNHYFSKNSLHNSFKIIEKGYGKYVGFMTDKTHRFLLEDFTVTHNCLNVRNSIPTTIAKNKVITDLIQALGLRHDLDYTDDKNYKTLAYGRVIILTDADVDGLHISGLILNFFHYLFPSLLERKEPYIVSMCTPIVRVFNPKGDLLFYDENKFRKFASEQIKTFKSKYYKGLGTTKPEDVKDTFGLKMIEYINDDNSVTSMNKIFHKKFSDARKEWLENYDINPEFSLDDEGNIVNMTISNFLNNEVIKFSHNDCKRSIPCLFDGLKESQRKILYAVKKRNLTYNKQSLKVAQLGGYVAEHTNYHHGEQNLFDTIINMAQDFVGSNNIPLFYRDGMFGTRLVGGKDSASPRYIFTKMESITPYIFREEDDVLLEHVIDDGDIVEPKFYIPIIPMILVNGTIGIGTGWSSSVPCYNPLDLIKCIKLWLDNDGEVILTDPDDGTIVSMLPEIEPWYRDFKGKIEKSKDNKKYISYGCFNRNKDKIEITELPIGLWTDKFKENAEDWLVDKKIKSLKNYSTPREVNFLITESEDGFECNINNMGLYSYLHTTNMVLFNEKEQLKKYTFDEIINDFCILRYQFYTKRKNYIINKLEKELKHLGNKKRFIQQIIDKELNIMNIDEDIIIKELEKRGYDKETKTQDADEEDNKNGYNYLLKLPVRTLTANQVKKIKNDIESLMKELDIVKKTSEKKMWLNDLKEFEDEYTKWIKKMNNMSSKDDKKETKKRVLKNKK